MGTAVCRKIWNLPHSLQCKLVGTAFNDEEARRLAQALHLQLKEDCRTSAHVHQAILARLQDRNDTSIAVQKIIRKRLDRYGEILEGKEWGEILATIENGNFGDAPVSGYLWAALHFKNMPEGGDDQLFSAVHMLEHKALREYPKLTDEYARRADTTDMAPAKEMEKKERVIARLREKLKESNRKLQLRAAPRQGRVPPRESPTGPAGQPSLREKRFAEENELLKREVSFLSEEIRRLLDEQREENEQCPASVQSAMADQPCACAASSEFHEDCCGTILAERLRGKRVAMVGGVDTLVPHIRQYIEEYGGTFHYHDGGESCGGKKIDSVVSKVDVVLCPVSINSHFACKYVKKCCRVRKKPCLFLKSSGISSVKKTLTAFARSHWKPGKNDAPSGFPPDRAGEAGDFPPSPKN